MSKVITRLFFFAIFIQILSCQTYFNYVANGNFQNNTCTYSQLSYQYGCSLSLDSNSWTSDNLDGNINSIQLEYGYNYFYTSSSSIVACLDWYHVDHYHYNPIITVMHPITAGTYRLTFTAYTRRTGSVTNYYFYVYVFDSNGNNYLNGKMYQFSYLGQMSITQIITISSPPYGNKVNLKFSPSSLGNSYTSTAVGISDVKFERISSCNSNETSVVLTSGQTACIENYVIQSVNYCTSWSYYNYYQASGAPYSIYKFFSCSSCSSGKLVGVYDATISLPYSFAYYKYGCTINQIPNTLWYRRLMIQDQKGKYFYTSYYCNGNSIYYLIVPNITYSGYDSSSFACGISSDSSVTHWQVANSTYYPAKCYNTGYCPVITSSTSRYCQYISSPITNCAIYLANYKCASCGSNTTPITWNNSGTLTNLCVTNSQQIYNCTTYVVVSGAYVCSVCDTGYTLSTLNSVKVCIRNDLLDGNCTNYVLNTNYNYECTVCGTGYTLSTVNTTAGQIKRCLSTTTQIIRDCLVYEVITGGYDCYQCSTATNIARYLLICNSVSAYRCLNTLTEFITNCGTYDFVNSLYKCSACSTSYTLANVTINSVVQLKCLTTATQVVSNCVGYAVDASSNYICSSCATGYTLKTVSGVPKCLLNAVIDAQCTTYILNGSNFECSACNSLYTVSSVYVTSVTYKYCLLTTSLIRDCSVYESISGGYQCNQCSTQSNIARYTFLLNGVQAYRCLNTVSEYVSSCSTYQLASQIYTCTACDSGYEIKNILINSVSQPRCLNSLTQIVSSCTAYVTDATNGYVCSSCSSSYTLKPISSIPKCLPDSTIVTQCTTYILNGSNFQCSACNSGYNLRPVSGVPKCIPDAQTVDKCTNYTLEASSKFSCSICDTGYTLKPVSGINKCLPNKVIDSQCTTYILNGNSFECSQCNSLYSLQSVFKNAQTFKNCLLTSTETIRDCNIYQIISQKYECKQCSSTASIARYSFTFNSLQTHRCLNSLSQYVQFCTTYQFSNQIYECTQCQTSYLRSDVTINQEEKVKCLTKASEVVQDCKHYVFDSISSVYSCDQCDDQFTLKTDADSNICVHDGDIQDDCIQYKDNGDSEVCTKCSSSFTLSDVAVDNVLTVQCLSDDEEIVTGCKTYEQISLSYDCTECQASYSKETVAIHAISTFRCLLQASQVIEDCLTYSVNSQEVYVCNTCANGFSLQSGIDKQKVCTHNTNIQLRCIEYKDNGAIEVCTKCQNLFSLETVSINGNSVKKCLSKATQTVTGCKTYEEIGGVSDCIECNAEYSKENVLILAIGYPRCLLKNTQVIEDCKNYLVDGLGNYSCDQCKQNYSLKAGLGGKICVGNSNVQTNCLQYRDNGAYEECFKCNHGFTISEVNVTSISDRLKKQCLSNSLQILKGCKYYKLASDGKYQCTDCNTGFTKSDVQIQSQTHVRCLSSTEKVQDCKTYIINQVSSYVCKDCNSGYALQNSTVNKVCVKQDMIESHCIGYKDNGAIEQCIKCELNYTLSIIFSGQSQTSQCLETKTKLITGCKAYEILSTQELQCKECYQTHSLQTVFQTQTKSLQKCIASQDVVQECLGYVQVGMSCAHDCNSCSSGFQLAVVRIPHRITKGCLSKTTEYLPFCLLHSFEHGEYYCRHGVCEKGAFSVFIGAGENQIACTKDPLIEYVDDENCKYFQRPKLADTELKCKKCKDGFSEPYCTSIDGYQGLTSGN